MGSSEKKEVSIALDANGKEIRIGALVRLSETGRKFVTENIQSFQGALDEDINFRSKVLRIETFGSTMKVEIKLEMPENRFLKQRENYNPGTRFLSPEHLVVESDQ